MPPSRSYTPSNGLRDESHIHDLHHFLFPAKRTVRAALYNPSGPANTHGKAMLCCVTGSRPIRISWVVPSEPGESRTERLIENILCVLLSNPLEQLDIRHNGSLLEIFEAYRHQVDLIRELRQALSEGVSMQGIVDRTKSDKREKLNRVPEPTQQRSEGLCLPEHVDRPLACSVDDQLLPVTDDSTDPFARPSDHKETVFEFLEHSHALAEQGFGNQRGMCANAVQRDSLFDFSQRPCASSPLHRLATLRHHSAGSRRNLRWSAFTMTYRSAVCLRQHPSINICCSQTHQLIL